MEKEVFKNNVEKAANTHTKLRWYMPSYDLNYSRLKNGLLLDCTTTWSAELRLSALKKKAITSVFTKMSTD